MQSRDNAMKALVVRMVIQIINMFIQKVERLLSKQTVAGSTPASRLTTAPMNWHVLAVLTNKLEGIIV